MQTIRQAMELAGQNLLAMLDRSNHYLPHWSVDVDDEGRGVCESRWWSHNVGRWWDAMLRLEAATGFWLPTDVEGAMLNNLHVCLDNPLGIGCQVQVENGRLTSGWVDGHTQREFLLALACLVRYRSSRWAAQQGRRMIQALDSYLLPDGRWDLLRMKQVAEEAGIRAPENPGQLWMDAADARLTFTHGRMIEGLMEFYRVSGYGLALDLADRLARFHLEHSTREDGSVPATPQLQTHSVLGTLRGLLLYGLLTRQQRYVQRAATCYQHAVKQAVKGSGFTAHDWGGDSQGETASPGDAAQLAMWLSHLGYSEFLDDAERLVRSRLLVSQVTRKPTTVADGEEDVKRNLGARMQGAFGGLHGAAHGKTHPTTWITAANLHTLTDIHHRIVETSPAGLWVNFHLDFQDQRLTLTTHSGEQRAVQVDMNASENLFLRIPRWTHRESVRLVVNGQPIPVNLMGDFAYVPSQTAPSSILLEYDLPLRRETEMADGGEHRFLWRGDEVVGVVPNVAIRPFYPSA